MTSIFLLIISSLAFNIFLIINPLSIGATILLIALSVAILFSFTISSWIAFLIFLIYISGILVIFSYFVSTTPNQTINIMSIIITIALTFFSICILSIQFNIKTLIIHKYSIQSNIFYIKLNRPTLLFLALILLITIIIVVKLTFNSKGPLRPFNNKYV